MRIIFNWVADHFWGIIEGALFGFAIGLFFSVLNQIGWMSPAFEALEMAAERQDAINRCFDIVGYISLIGSIVSGIPYAAGRALGKYRRFLR